jgi:hypothetical protein
MTPLHEAIVKARRDGPVNETGVSQPFVNT